MYADRVHKLNVGILIAKDNGIHDTLDSTIAMIDADVMLLLSTDWSPGFLFTILEMHALWLGLLTI